MADGKMPGTPGSKTFLIWIVLIVMFLVVWQSLSDQSAARVTNLSYTEFMRRAEAGEFSKAVVSEADRAMRAEAKDAKDKKVYGARYAAGTDVVEKLRAAKIDVEVVPGGEGRFWVQLLVSWLPMLLLVGLFIFFLRGISSQNGKAMSFGASKAKLIKGEKVKVRFGDVIGAEETVQEVQELVEFLKNPKEFGRLGGKVPKGVLMMGPPGCGKTLLAKAMAGEAGVPFFSVSGSDFVEMFVGVGASRVRDLFEQGRKNAPCIIFIDEIDAVGRHRGAGLGGGHDEREQTLNQLLVEMDGFGTDAGVLIVAATNRPDVLDPALTRAGRFDRRVVVHLPDREGRMGILAHHAKVTTLDADVDFGPIADLTPRKSGADLENIVQEAILAAGREKAAKVSQRHFDEAVEKVSMGPERKRKMSARTKLKIAWHEAGHAMVVRAFPERFRLHKVTVRPRGQALGLTWYTPVGDELIAAKSELEQAVKVAFGGRIGELMFSKELSTGASNDLQNATQIVEQMVRDFGMSDDLGHVSYDRGGGQLFLGRDMFQKQEFSEETARMIDADVRKVLKRLYEETERDLTAKAPQLKMLAETLASAEVMTGAEVDALLAGTAV